jgi:type VI secretion system protein ImpL
VNFTSWFTQQTALYVMGFFSLLTAGAALMLSKYPVRWLLGVATVFGVVAVLFLYQPRELDPDLPDLFEHNFKPWLLILSLTALYALTHFTYTLVRHYALPAQRAADKTPAFPDLDAAWDEILIKLSQARIDPARQQLFFLLTPGEPPASTLIDAAGLQLFTAAPAAAEAPIHCYAAADALFLSVGGASALGRQDAEGGARLKYLCQRIAALGAEPPTLRGTAVLIPFEWATGKDSLRRVAAVRDDLQTIQATLQVRAPVLVVFCLQESMPGFNEFAARMPAKLRQRRCGFAVPTSLGFSGDVVRRGMRWMVQWFHSWSLNLMVLEIDRKDGNNRLMDMLATFRSDQAPLVNLIDSALTTHLQDEPVLFRGCYFVACGPDPEKRAFAAGLLRKPDGRLLTDAPLTHWARGAGRLDRSYRRIALALGLITAAVALPIWYFGIIRRLEPLGTTATAIGWAGLGTLAAIWAALLGGMALRGRRPKAPPTPAKAS